MNPAPWLRTRMSPCTISWLQTHRSYTIRIKSKSGNVAQHISSRPEGRNLTKLASIRCVCSVNKLDVVFVLAILQQCLSNQVGHMLQISFLRTFVKSFVATQETLPSFLGGVELLQLIGAISLGGRIRRCADNQLLAIYDCVEERDDELVDVRRGAPCKYLKVKHRLVTRATKPR